MSRNRWIMLAGTCVALSSPVAAADCGNLAPTQGEASVTRDIQPADLVGLRDIGQPWEAVRIGASAIAVSPSGTDIAFQIRQADSSSNSYCFGLYVMRIGSNQQPRQIDVGGEFIMQMGGHWTIADVPIGVPSLITPRWSPDGKSVAYLRRENGRTQVWRADAAGGGSAPITHSPDDVLDFRWTADGSSIVYSAQPALRAAYEKFDQEGLTGYHYDGRFKSNSYRFPKPYKPVQTDFFKVRLGEKTAIAATADEAGLLTVTASGEVVVDPTTGAKLWVASLPAEPNLPRPLQVRASVANGTERICKDPACKGQITGLWWAHNGKTAYFFRRDGWANSQTGMYVWAPGRGQPRRTFLTDDIYTDCQSVTSGLVCLYESSLQPRQIVLFDPETGRRDTIFDPNPEWRSLRRGHVERLHWKNDRGIETIGDLLLPPDHVAGQKHPMVVVQYQTRGFLRGGTGDEYPIQALAAHGFAVLSFSRPRDLSTVAGVTETVAAANIDLKGWADRRSVLSALEAGVDIAISKGVVDPEKVGISGMSDGASTVQFALVNSKKFAAAAMTSCCVELNTFILTGPPAATAFEQKGYPKDSDYDFEFWRPYSLVLNASKIKTPLLMQMADDELLIGLSAYKALKDKGAAVDLYVFPGEFHNKWQPAHRLAIYQRNINWFDFWLNDRASRPIAESVETVRWRKLQEGIRP